MRYIDNTESSHFLFKDPIFHEIEAAINFLDSNNLLNRNCANCYNLMYVKIFNENLKKYGGLKCPTCNKKMRIIARSKFKNSKFDINDILWLTMCFLLNIKNYQITYLTNIAENSYIYFKERLLDCIRTVNNEQFSPIGGDNIVVEVDETVVVRGRLILNPSNIHDGLHNSTWLVGGIENSPMKKFFLMIVPNRRAQTLTNMMSDKIRRGSILRTDGYPSYPSVALALQLQHEIVNHSTGFVNEFGQSTNNIENFWLPLKTEIKSRYGVLHARIPSFIDEFIFRKNNIDNTSKNSVSNAFKLLIRMIFSD